MSNIEIQRDHTGTMHLIVGDQAAIGSTVAGMQIVNGEMTAIVWVPLSAAKFGEVKNVIPFVRPAKRG